jgi:hypothetical protein
MSKPKAPAPPPAVNVVPNGGEGWKITRDNGKRASAVVGTKAEAVDRAREIAQNQGAELVVRNQDGRIAVKDSHGRDSPKRKG